MKPPPVTQDTNEHGAARTLADQRLDRFDEAWQQGLAPCIRDFLPSEGAADYVDILAELIKIDLEYRWRSRKSTERRGPAESSSASLGRDDALGRSAMLLPDYQRQYPQLGDENHVALALVVEEYRVRRQWGDCPGYGEYLLRYPSRATELSAALAAVDQELGSAQIAGLPSSRSLGETESSTTAKIALPDLQVGQDIDDFRLLNDLGAGAFARVFLAQQKSMQRIVALKISSGHSSESLVLSQLDHANIVRVYDQRRVGDLHLLYMQYAPGGALEQVIDRIREVVAQGEIPAGGDYLATIAETLARKGESPTDRRRSVVAERTPWGTVVCFVGARLADALRHAHGMDVWHRDIKPANILLTADGQPMLADFNMSFGASLEGTRPDDFFGGSLSYMSPEQLEVILLRRSADDIRGPSDVYSLAIVLWEMLTGSRPFPDEDQSHGRKATLEKMLVRRMTSPDPCLLPVHVPRGLTNMLVESLQPLPQRRPTPPAMARALQLSTMHDVDRLLAPAPDSWSARWTRHPVLWLLIFGMIPNGTIAVLNLWANRELMIKNFDAEYFHRVQVPVVTLIGFALGIGLCLWILVPVLRCVSSARGVGFQPANTGWKPMPRDARRRTPLDDAHRQRGAQCCLAAPGVLSATIMILWLATGLVFPIWNYLASPKSRVTGADVFSFFSSQLLHGLIAGSLTAVFFSLVMVQSLYARCMPAEEDRGARERLMRLDVLVNAAVACLGLTPMLAVLALALSDRMNTAVFLALSITGFAGHLVASILAPAIRTRIHSLRWASSSTEELLSQDVRGPSAEAATHPLARWLPSFLAHREISGTRSSRRSRLP